MLLVLLKIHQGWDLLHAARLPMSLIMKLLRFFEVPSKICRPVVSLCLRWPAILRCPFTSAFFAFFLFLCRFLLCKEVACYRLGLVAVVVKVAIRRGPLLLHSAVRMGHYSRPPVFPSAPHPPGAPHLQHLHLLIFSNV